MRMQTMALPGSTAPRLHGNPSHLGQIPRVLGAHGGRDQAGAGGGSGETEVGAGRRRSKVGRRGGTDLIPL